MTSILCEKCGSDNIILGGVHHSGSILFVPKDENGLYIKKASKINVKACKDCGHLFDFTLESPEKI